MEFSDIYSWTVLDFQMSRPIENADSWNFQNSQILKFPDVQFFTF